MNLPFYNALIVSDPKKCCCVYTIVRISLFITLRLVNRCHCFDIANRRGRRQSRRRSDLPGAYLGAIYGRSACFSVLERGTRSYRSSYDNELPVNFAPVCMTVNRQEQMDCVCLSIRREVVRINRQAAIRRRIRLATLQPT